MTSNDVLLPKHVSDSCYASLKQIYADLFHVPQNSHLFTSSTIKRRNATIKKAFALDRLKKSHEPDEFGIRPSGRNFSKVLDTIEKTQKQRDALHLGQVKRIREGSIIEVTTKF